MPFSEETVGGIFLSFHLLLWQKNGTTYRCKITDSSGNVAYSDSATVHIDPIGFITQPEDCICSPSGTANFSVEAHGTGITYQWQWQAPGSNTWTNSNAVGAQTNAISEGVSGDNGTVYRCVITDSSGNVAYSEPAKIIPYAITWEYTYDANGLRTHRTNDVVSYDYIYNGSSLTQLTVTQELDCSTTVMDISYDAAGKPMSLTCNGTKYIYVTNVQGDIIALLNTSGTAVVKYTYDAWGNILSTTGSMATTLGALNPLRYRGYVYDSETGLYYLQSRYYNPEVGRFINSDVFTSTGQGLFGSNMFAYCLNNPVVYKDTMGQSVILACVIVGGIIGCAIGSTIGSLWATNVKGLSSSDGWDYWKCVLSGGLIGAAVGSIIGYGIGVSMAPVAPMLSQSATYSWAQYRAVNTIGSSSYAIGNAFESWFYDAYNVASRQISEGRCRFDAIVGNRIIELKNYNWSLYSNHAILARRFVNQAYRYLEYVGRYVGDTYIKGITFYFSSKPPQVVIDALELLDIIVDWAR